MLQAVKPASECRDCKLCPRGQAAATADIPVLPAPAGMNGSMDNIVQEVLRQIQGIAGNQEELRQVPVGVSARHCHLSQEAVEILFGPGYELNVYRDLYQPGAFAAEEVISVVGPRLRAIERVRILGPTRGYNQVELARTDAIYLGVDPPVRDSGDLDGANRVTFIGPKGSVTVDGAIRAARHIHMTPDEVARRGLTGQDRVNCRVGGEKGLVYHNVRLKIDPSYVSEIHLDTDDANAAELVCGDTVTIEA